MPSVLCYAPLLTWASMIPRTRNAAAEASSTVVVHGAGEYDTRLPGGGSASDEGIVRRSPLLEKYVYRETIRTEIAEEHLPGLEGFLESVGLQHKLEVLTTIICKVYVLCGGTARSSRSVAGMFECGSICIRYSRTGAYLYVYPFLQRF